MSERLGPVSAPVSSACDHPNVDVGVDVVAISRVEDLCEDAGFVRRVFTDGEIEYCENGAYPAEHYAGRWCVKEAVRKLVARPGEVAFRDVAVAKDGPRPTLAVSADVERRLSEAVGGEPAAGVDANVSLSHDRTSDTAIGVVTVARREKDG